MSAPYYQDDQITLWHGDSLAVLRQLPDASVNCCVTSPPYFGLRDYGQEGQYGLEASPAEYVETMRALFAEVHRVLADDGTLWLNLGDSYVGSGKPGGVSRTLVGTTQQVTSAGKIRPKPGVPKNLLGIPWRVAFALQDDDWILRNDIIWAKPNAMPESVTDRLSTRHEHLFMLSKSPRYWFDLDPIREQLLHPDAADGTRVFGGKNGGDGKVGSSYRTAGGMPNTYGKPRSLDEPANADRGTHDRGRNPGDVWTIATQPFSEAHFAVMPRALAERAILAGCKPGGTVLDPFSGSGTTGAMATKHGRKYVGIDLSAEYLDLSLRTRFAEKGFDFGEATA